MEITVNKTKFFLIEGDITLQSTDAIVNAANSGLMGGGGVDGAIHKAGGLAILEECKIIRSERGKLPTGKAVITSGGNLKARYVIHTVGPVWQGGHKGEQDLLASAYQESMKIAVHNGIKTISFPSISTGAYGYPIKLASEIAIRTVTDFIKKDTSFTEIFFVLFDLKTYNTYEQTLQKLKI